MSQVPSLTATHLYHYATCEHRVRLDLFGDHALCLADTETERALKARGVAHEAAIAAERGYPRPAHGHEDLARAFDETLALMGEGREGIYQGVLIGCVGPRIVRVGSRFARDLWAGDLRLSNSAGLRSTPDPASDALVGMPDLLLRQEGRSQLGAHHYTVGDVKISRRARSDQALQVAFYAHLLGLVQGRIPERLFLLLGDGREEWFAYEDVGGAFDQVLADLLELRAGRIGTEPFLKPACAACPWRGVCLPELEARGDLSLVPGMTPARRRALRRADVTDIPRLAGAKAERLEGASGLEAPTLRLLIRQALSLAEGRPVPIAGCPAPPGPPDLLVTALEHPGGEGHALLLTISFTDPREGPKTALLWTENPVDEKALYEKALRAFARKPAAPVYHYGPLVPALLARMEARHGAGDPGFALLDRLIDVAPWVKRAAALPVHAYTLAEVARATGHEGPEVETLLDVLELDAGDVAARGRLLAAADAQREALRHLLQWLRRDP